MVCTEDEKQTTCSFDQMRHFSTQLKANKRTFFLLVKPMSNNISGLLSRSLLLQNVLFIWRNPEIMTHDLD